MENNEPQVQSWDDEVQVKPLAPTKESAVVTASNQKQSTFMSTSDKQTGLLNTAEQKKKGIQRDTDPVNRIDTNKVSFDNYRSMFPPETPILDIQIDYHKNKMLDKQTEYAKNALVSESFRDRTTGEVAGDSALSLAKNTVTFGQMALGITDLAGRVVGADNAGDVTNKALGYLIAGKKQPLLPANATKRIDEEMSSKVQAQQELVQQRVAEVAERNKAGIAALGDKATWWDDTKSIGSETSETISALIDNPSAAADVALSSALAFTVPALVSKGLTKAAIKNATPDDIAKLISSGKLDKLGEAGAVIGTAGLEGFSQAYEEKQKVLDMPVDTLRQNSKEFQKLESQHGEAKAKQMIADSVFQSNLGLTALLAGVASKVSGAAKLERDLFIGSNTITAMGKEALEEASQSLTGQGAANYATQTYVDNKQTLSEGVGQAIGTGIAGAVLSTGALSGTAGALSQISKGSAKVINKVADTAAKQQELDSILVEVATTGDFSRLDARTDLSAQDKMDLVLDPKVLGNASEETFEKIAAYAQKLASEKPPAERTAREDTAAETIGNVRTKMDREQIEPILGDLSSFDPDKEDVVLRKLGSSADAFSDDDLVNLMDHVSEENRPLLQSHMEARNAIAEYEATNNKTIDDVHNDVMVGSKGYRGINDFIRQFKSALSTNSDDTASGVLDSLNKFTVRQTNKLTDMTALMQLQKTEGNSPRYLTAMQNYRDKYNVPAEDSIHRGSGKLVDKLTTEVKALSAVYDSLGMSYQYNTKQSYAPLQADTVSTIIPAKVAVTPKVTAPVAAPKAPQSVATTEPSPSTPVVSAAPVVDSTQQDRAAAEAKTAELKARVGAKLDAMSEEAKPTASSEAAVAGKAVADDTNGVVPKEGETTEAVTEPSEEPMNKVLLAEAVQREVATPIIKAVNTNKRTVDKGKLKEGISSFTKALTRTLGTVKNSEIVQKLQDFSKGVQNAVSYSVNTKSDNESYKAGVLLAKKSFKFNLALDLVRNTVHNNLPSVFFKPVNKNNALSNYNDLNNFLEDKLDQFGIKNPASIAVVNNFKEFHEKFKESLLKIYKPAYNTDAMLRENDYFHLLTNEDGLINENVIMAMSATAYGWLSDGASTIIEHDDEAINNLLGFDEKQYVPPKLFEAMSKVGLPASEIGDQLGSKTLSTLGLKFNDSGITEAQQATTVSAVGVWLVSAMQDAGFVKSTVYGSKDYLNAGIADNIVESFIPTEVIKSKGISFKQRVGTVMYIAPVTKEQTLTIEEDGKSKEIKFTGLVDLINTGIGLQREERRSLGDDEDRVALETLFGITSDRPEPSFKKPTKARATVRKTGQAVSKQQQKDMLFAAQQPWQLTDTYESLKSMDVGLVKHIMGYRTEDEINAMHITQRAKAKAKSQGIERTIESLWSFASRVNGRDFFINLDPWVNTRMGYATNLDPQGNKEVRRLFGLKENRSLVDFNNPEHVMQFRLALMDAFNIKLKWDIIGSSKLEDTINDPVINAAIETLKTNNPDGNLIVAAVDKLGTGLHGYQGLLAVSKMTADKPFETDLILESDGVSNGVAIAMWQFAGARGKQFADAMHRVGIYRNTDGYTTYTQWSANPKNLDSYQALAKTWDGALQYFKNAVLGGKTLDDRQGSLALYSKKTMAFKVSAAKDKFIKLSGSKDPVEMMKNLNLLVGDLTDKIGEVTKGGRDLAKPITMRNIYSAGKTSLVKAVVDSVIDNMHTTLSKGKREDLEKLEYVFNELFDTAEIFSTANVASYIRELDFYAMTVQVNGETMTVDQALFGLIDNSYGVAMEGAMHSLYGRLLDNRAVANEAAEYAFYVMDEVFKIAEQAYKDKHGITNLSIAQRNEVLESIKDVIPVGLTPSADDKDSSITLYKEKTTNTYDKAYKVLVSFRNTVEGKKSRTSRSDKLSFEAFGVGFIPVSIQVIDAHSMMNTLGKYPLLNGHDAVGVGITRVGEVTRGINESFNYNALSKFNIERNTRDMLKNSIEQSKQWGVEDIAWKRMSTRYNKNTRAWEDKKVKYDSPEALLAKLSANYEESEKIRASYPIGVVGQYENLNGSYVLTDAEQDATDMTIVSMLKEAMEEQLQAEEQADLFIKSKAERAKLITKFNTERKLKVLLKYKNKLFSNTYFNDAVKITKQLVAVWEEHKKLDEANKLSPFNKTDARKLDSLENKMDVLSKEVFSLLEAGTVSTLLPEVRNTVSEILNDSSAETLDESTLLEVFGTILEGEESQYRLFGSQAKDNATVDFSNAVTQVVDTPDNSMDMFNTLGSMGNVQDSDEHTEHLKSVLADVVNKVLQPTTVVLGEVNGPNRGSYFKTLNGINKIELATTVGDFWYGLSAQEVYVHEQVHNVVGYALSTGTAVVKRITAMFNAVKELVDDGTITYVDFLPEGVTNPTDEQIKDAQQRLDYVFNNTKLSVREITDPETGLKRKVKTNAALEEFVAFGTTNKAFMSILNNPKVALKLKSKLKTVRNKTKSNTLAVKLFDSMVNALLDIVQIALDMITDKLYGLDGKAMDKQLVILMSRLAGVEGKTQSKIYEYFDKASTLLPVSQAITNYILEPISKLVQSPLVKNNRFRVVRTAGNVVRAIKATKGSKLTQSLLADAMRKTRSRFNFTHDNLANSLAQELVGVTANNRKWHKLLRLSNKYIDQLRKHIATNIKNILNEQYSYTLNKEEKESITLVGVKTDLSVLLKSGYTHQEIYTLVKDEAALTTAIDNARKVIEGSFAKTFTRRALRQADALANLMIIGGEVRANQNLNAHNIAHEFGMTKSRGQIDTVLAEAQLDEYITLKALSLVSDDLKKRFVGVIDKEIANGKAYNDNGVSFTLDYHNQYKEDALAENFKGNKVSVQKGYIKEIRDPNVSIEIAPKYREAELIALGYEATEIVVEGDYIDPSEGKMYVYVNNSAKLATNSTGIVSLTGTRAAGSKLIDNMARRPNVSDNLGLDAYLDKRVIEQRMRLLADLDIAPGAVTNTGIALIPIYNLDGSIKSYRYMMTEANRKKLFNRHDSFDDVLAGMAAHVKDKVNTQTINTAVVKLAKEQYDADFKKAPNDFVFIGKTSSDPELKEMWFTLPEGMRMEANKVFNEGIYIKKKDLRLVMGFRKFTVGEWAKKKQQAMKDTNKIASAAATYVLTLLQKPIVGNTEELWQELVRMAKDIIVVKTGAVTLGNIISNYAVLATEGIPTSDIVKYSIVAWKGATKYQQDKNKLDKLKVEVNAKGNLSPIQLARMNREIALLENSISTNPIYPLVEQGIYQTIVEDIEADEDTFSFKSKLEDKTSIVTDYIPDSIKDVGKVLFMTHDTQLYKFMRNATQVSDFVGRFVLHQHNMNKLGMKEDASVDNIVETFINYDLPTHRSIQYLNDMGLIMFTKFFIRVQKVILRQLTTRTANVMSLLLMQWALDIPISDILDSNALGDDAIENKWNSPAGVLGTLVNTPPLLSLI